MLAMQAIADSMFIPTNQPSKLRIAALKPPGIIGEHDAQVIPGLTGHGPFQFGDGKNKFDFIYASNVGMQLYVVPKSLLKRNAEKVQAGDKIVVGEAFWDYKWATNGILEFRKICLEACRRL
jgi:hypothetical protein